MEDGDEDEDDEDDDEDSGKRLASRSSRTSLKSGVRRFSVS